jgi:hypothetical protein
MSGGDQRKPGPLWQFVPLRTAHVPPVKRTDVPVDRRVIPRDPTPEELEPLRVDGDWMPAVILRRFGPATKDSEYLPRLIIACAVLQGAHRMRELADRLTAMITVATPRVQRMIEDQNLERRKSELEGVLQRLSAARADLPASRARAYNELDHNHPDGLRGIDLEMLVSDCEAAILGSEIATKRNLTGIDFSLRLAASLPEQRFADDWVDRALGGPLAGLPPGILLFTPPEYGRVVVVHADGRLAYDPAQSEDDADR